MAFGVVMKNWGVLLYPLNVSVHKIKFIVMAIARLNIVLINERLFEQENCYVFPSGKSICM